MNKKKLYRVNIWEESGGYVDIEAESLDKAEEDVGELLLEHSFDGVMYPIDEHLVRDDCGRDYRYSPVLNTRSRLMDRMKFYPWRSAWRSANHLR